MNLTNLSLVYSPTSPIVESVLMNSLFALFGANAVLLPLFSNVTSKDVSNGLHNFITIRGFDSKNDLSHIYLQEEASRSIIAAVQFDDSLLGKFVITISIPLYVYVYV